MKNKEFKTNIRSENNIEGYKKLIEKIKTLNESAKSIAIGIIIITMSMNTVKTHAMSINGVTLNEPIDESYAIEVMETVASEVNARSAVLIEPYTGKILFEQDKDEQFPPASVTKVMTMLLIYEAIGQGKISLTDEVTVSAYAAGMGGSQIFLEAMEVQPVEDLVKSIVIASANDSAVAMAEYLAGSEEAFVVLMNKKAKELGMNNTNFANACGLDDPSHLTTAYDIGLMTKELVTKYPEVLQYTNIWQDTITHKTARGEEEFVLTNTNRLIKNYQGATGLKTGSTSEALYCLSGTAERNGLSLIAVVMGAPDPTTRFAETMKLFDYGYANFGITTGAEKGMISGEVSIHKGVKDSVEVMVKEQVSALVPKGSKEELTSKIEIVEFLNAPVDEGTKAGEIIFYYNDEEVGRSDLVTTQSIERAGFMDTVEKLLVRWFEPSN